MCLYPKLIKNRKYTANKKNGGVIPTATDPRTLFVPVGCGRCIECMKQKSRQWQVRLQEEIRTNTKGLFVTLTFSNEAIASLTGDLYEENGGEVIEGYELDNQIATLAMRRFLERWRKKYKKSIKHWFITELGENGTENVHMHGLILPKKSIKIINKKTNKEEEINIKEEIKNIWKYGHVYIGDYVNNETINYITKYITKRDLKHCEYQPKILTSKGIGKEYINRADAKTNKYNERGTKEVYTTRQGIKINLPIYYRNKIYTEEEREKLWIEKLDKQERWVCGEKIDVSTPKGWERYFKTVEYYRKKNKQLGYGSDEKNWNRKQYENQIRNLKNRERIENGKSRKIQKMET